MSAILVCPSLHAAEVARALSPSHALGMHAPGEAAWTPEGGGSCSRPAADLDAALTLAFHDIDAPRPGLVPPEPEDADAILSFGRAWPGRRPLLVHCRMGISRSTAAAFAIACDRAPPGAEGEIAAALRAASPCATPNPRLVALADARLGRGGRMIRAVAAIGRGADYEPYRLFRLELQAASRSGF